MKRSKGSRRHLRQPTPPERRAQLLSEFERSGMSAAAFARKHDIGYSTFCGWRQHRPDPGFVQVELSEASEPVELVVELGAQARLRIGSADQVDLVVQLLQQLNTTKPC